MTAQEFDHKMAQIDDLMASTSSKLGQLADLNLLLGRKLDRRGEKVDKRAGVRSSTEQKLDQLAELSTHTEQKIDGLSDKIDKLADVSASTNQKLDRLVEALLRREGQ